MMAVWGWSDGIAEKVNCGMADYSLYAVLSERGHNDARELSDHYDMVKKEHPQISNESTQLSRVRNFKKAHGKNKIILESQMSIFDTKSDEYHTFMFGYDDKTDTLYFMWRKGMVDWSWPRGYAINSDGIMERQSE